MALFEPQKVKDRFERMRPISIEENNPSPIQPLEKESEPPTDEKIPIDTKIIKVQIADLVDFANHPFTRGTAEKMQELAKSIEENGLFTPPIVRPSKAENGKYEILAGHRRRDACQMVGLEEIEVVCRDVDDDTAALIMVSSNLEQRDRILPVDRGYAYKIMLEALKRQGERTDLTSRQVVEKLADEQTDLTSPHIAAKSNRSDDEIAEKYNTSGDTIRRYIRLTELIPALQKRTNANHIGFTPAVDLSYLDHAEQEVVEATIVAEGISMSGPMAKKLKELSKTGRLSEEGIVNSELILYVMTEKKELVTKEVKLTISRFRDMLPESLKTMHLSNEQSDAILEEAMTLFREKYEKQESQLKPLDELLDSEEDLQQDDESEWVM